MGIFDDFIQGINREISKVQARSQEMMQTYQLNSQVHSLEGKINAAFIELGRLVYDKYARGHEVTDEQLIEKTQEIVAWEQEIVSLKAEIEVIKAQYSPETSASQKADFKAGWAPTPGFVCPTCQAPANVEKAFCPACGGALKKEPDGAKPAGGNGSGASAPGDGEGI